MRERAQLVIIAALALATVFVGLALILNSALFVENVATQQSDTAQTEAIKYHHASTTAVAGLIDHVNHDNATSRAALRANLTAGAENWSHIAVRGKASGGASPETAVVTVTNGTQIRQTNASRNFTAGGAAMGDENWTLADAERTRRFRLNVSQNDLYQSSADGSFSASELDTVTQRAFHVGIDGSTTTAIYLFSDADGTVRVFVENTTGYYGANDAGCQADSAWVTVELVEGTVNGTTCAALDAYATKTAHEITYENANVSGSDRATGTYELVAVTSSLPSGNYYDMDSGDSPFTAPAIYAATVRIEYHANDFDYHSYAKVVP